MPEAKAVMTLDVVMVKPSTPAEKVVETLIENNVTGLPVVDDDMTLAGIVTEKDVLNLLSDWNKGAVTAEDLMTKEVISFDQNEDLTTICRCLVKNHFRRVPILAEGKLIGIISRKDIIAHILELKKENRPVDPQLLNSIAEPTLGSCPCGRTK